MSILTIDDFQEERDLLFTILNSAGFGPLLPVGTAREGLHLLGVGKRGKQTSGIDLVLMDIMMPEMDGLTAMRAIRERPEWHKLPIIALTAKAMKNDQEQALAAGANDYMAKPLDVDQLLSLVRVWMPR